MKSLIIFLGGCGPEDLPLTESKVVAVIAADSGLDLAHSHGIFADVVVGDMDSVSPAALERARNEGSRIEVSPKDKDETDFELATSRL